MLLLLPALLHSVDDDIDDRINSIGDRVDLIDNTVDDLAHDLSDLQVRQRVTAAQTMRFKMAAAHDYLLIALTHSMYAGPILKLLVLATPTHPLPCCRTRSSL